MDRFAERVLDKNQNCIMTRERTEMPFVFQSRSINHRSFGICMRRSERASTVSRISRCCYLPSQRGTCLNFLHQIEPCPNCKRYSIFLGSLSHLYIKYVRPSVRSTVQTSIVYNHYNILECKIN